MLRFTSLSFVLLAVCSPRMSSAQPIGGWHVTAPMSVGRMSTPHALVALDDGRVLVAGGNTGHPTDHETASLASAEIFDLAGETWSTAPSMSTRRTHPMAARLGDGRVLVVGGFNLAGQVTLASAEIYDPALDEWTPASPMAAPRFGGTATLLRDGRVLVAGGGQLPANVYLATAEIYDPVKNRWDSAASLVVPHINHTATELTDGRILVAGGATNVAEVFDPLSGQWTPAGALSASRFNHGATLLLDGRVLVAGGQIGARTADLYDPTNNQWTRAADMNFDHGGVSLTTLLDGAALIGSGLIEAGGVSRTAERYDPLSDRWTLVGSMSEDRYYYGMVRLPDGRVLALGGCCEQQPPYARRSVEIFTAGCTSEATGDVQIFTSGFSSFLLPELKFQWVLVGNSSPSDIAGPVAYAPDGIQNAVPLTANSTICLGARSRPYFRIAAGPDDTLSPGEYRLALIWFYQTGPDPISYSPRVLAGLPLR
jgi:hypothetical protein